MATNLHQIYQNFIYKIESITPTHTKFCSRDFFNVDPLRLSEEESSGIMRGFSVFWLGSEEPFAPSDRYDRVAQHLWELRVVYAVGPDGLKWDDGHEIILQDHHDLSMQLRDTDSYTGYNASNPSTDINLKHRVLAGDDIDSSTPGTWVLRQRYRCNIFETEG